MPTVTIDISDDLEKHLRELADERFDGDINQVVIVAIKKWVDENG